MFYNGGDEYSELIQPAIAPAPSRRLQDYRKPVIAQTPEPQVTAPMRHLNNYTNFQHFHLLSHMRGTGYPGGSNMDILGGNALHKFPTLGCLHSTIILLSLYTGDLIRMIHLSILCI